jgi:hypothetical protein
MGHLRAYRWAFHSTVLPCTVYLRKISALEPVARMAHPILLFQEPHPKLVTLQIPFQKLAYLFS